MKVTFVGDIFPANLPYHNGFGIASEFNRHKGFPWIESIRNFFDGSDFVIGNLESPLVSDENFHLDSFAGSKHFAQFLKDSGINALSIANNHILEKGLHGFTSTIDALEDSDIIVIGATSKHGNSIQYLKKEDITIGISAFNAICDITNPNLYQDFSEEKIIQTLEKMVGVDFKILIFHWGNEYINIPSYNQIQQAYRFIDAGADIIIGHHSHVIQPIKRYKNGLIFFSLGNFLFDMKYKSNVRLGMCAAINLTKPKKIEYITQPIYISKNYTPVKFNQKKFNNLIYRHTAFMNELETKGGDYYNKVYNKLKVRKHLWQRTFMKIDLISSLFRVNRVERRKIFNRLWRKFLRKLTVR